VIKKRPAQTNRETGSEDPVRNRRDPTRLLKASALCALFSAACFNAEDTPTVGGTGLDSTTGSETENEATTAAMDTGATMQPPVGTSLGTTSEESTASPTTSGDDTANETGLTTTGSGCMPGVFDESQFDDACFQ
jgi:hypothetical protein